MTRWTRIRPDDGSWEDHVEWPQHLGDEDHLLIWNPCDGYHVWWRHARQCPPGTHFTAMPSPPSDSEYKVASPLNGPIMPEHLV